MKKWIFFLFLLLIPFSQTTAYNPWLLIYLQKQTALVGMERNHPHV